MISHVVHDQKGILSLYSNFDGVYYMRMIQEGQPTRFRVKALSLFTAKLLMPYFNGSRGSMLYMFTKVDVRDTASSQ